ncbi:MAG: hypothetical protein ACJZ85_00335 [Pontiellaceae bacterium]|nr:hypothetical protein [Kiritimatiellaceae bacterium]HBO87997.1 hypothetical protein [Verrucomicrobiota bacterium]
MRYLIFCLSVLLLAGCKTPVGPAKETKLTEKQQKAFLSKSKPARHFGYQVFPIARNEVGMRGSARLHPNHRAVVPMEKKLPVIEIAGRNYRDPAYALIDTASPNSWMEFNYSLYINTDFLCFREKNIPYRGSYNTGGVPAYAAIAYQLRIGQLFIEDMPLYIRMATGSLGIQARNIESPPLRAVLGYDLLKLFSYVQFNFINGTIDFDTMHSFVPNKNWLLAKTSILDKEDEGLVIEGALFGKETEFILDLAGDYHLAHANADGMPARQLSLGELVFRKVPQASLPSQALPRLGRYLLTDLIITICPQEGTVYFERPE